jgi:hypothetical protein
VDLATEEEEAVVVALHEVEARPAVAVAADEVAAEAGPAQKVDRRSSS